MTFNVSLIHLVIQIYSKHVQLCAHITSWIYAAWIHLIRWLADDHNTHDWSNTPRCRVNNIAIYGITKSTDQFLLTAMNDAHVEPASQIKVTHDENVKGGISDDSWYVYDIV